MNCKQGDLAVIVNGEEPHEGVKYKQGNLGRIVEVIAPFGTYPGYGFLWIIKSFGSPIPCSDGKVLAQCHCPDAWLRPIRPGELDDETQDNSELEGV
jgi:hypothetical protein